VGGRSLSGQTRGAYWAAVANELEWRAEEIARIITLENS